MKPTGEIEVRTYNLQKAVQEGDMTEADRLHEGYGREAAQLIGEMRGLASVEKDWRHDATMMSLFNAMYILDKSGIDICREVQEATRKLLSNKI